jgi:hypothetical protein
MIKSGSVVVSVKQKIEELTNYAKIEKNKLENIEVKIEVY